MKRVLARLLAFSADLAQGGNERALWDQATGLLPGQNLGATMPPYTQGLMDLGATICTARQPSCLLCPVQAMCQGFASGNAEKYPVKTRKLIRGNQTMSLLWAKRPDGAVWLEKRPGAGIWGGLYCLPAFRSDDELKAQLPDAVQDRLEALPGFVHALTHKDLHLAPWVAGFHADEPMPRTIASEARPAAWFSRASLPNLGLPAPIRKLLAPDASR